MHFMILKRKNLQCLWLKCTKAVIELNFKMSVLIFNLISYTPESDSPSYIVRKSNCTHSISLNSPFFFLIITALKSTTIGDTKTAQLLSYFGCGLRWDKIIFFFFYFFITNKRTRRIHINLFPIELPFRIICIWCQNVQSFQ